MGSPGKKASAVSPSSSTGALDASQAGSKIGKEASITGIPVEVNVYKGDTYLNYGAPYPNQTFIVVIPQDVTSKFPPGATLVNKKIEVSGKIELAPSQKPMIRLQSPDQLKQ